MATTLCAPYVDSELALRPYAEADYDRVRRMLLPTLSRLYPGGSAWLTRRLREVRTGGPQCHLAFFRDELVGVLIETPKSGRRVKISTLFVSPSWRGHGIGRRLFRFMEARWRNEPPSEVYITTALEVADKVERCLSPFGFARIALQVDRYGPGRSEVVLSSRPGQPRNV